GPRMEVRGGATCLMVEDLVVRNFSTLARAEERAQQGAPADAAPKTFSMGANNPDARLRDLDTDGVWAEVMYPNLGFFCCFHIRTPTLQVATARVYNDWVADEFIGASDRFAPAALIPILDIDAGMAELRRAAARGFRAALLPDHVDARPYNDPVYEPL